MNICWFPISATVIILAASWQNGYRSSLSFARLYQVDRVRSSSSSSIPRLTLRIDSRDWFWLTFTSQSRQEIRAPLTRVIQDIIPAIQDRLPNNDRIALASDDLTALEKVNKLLVVLDNLNDLTLVESFRSALVETNLYDKLRDEKFLRFALST
jgi:hypothetical protein